MTMKKDVLLLKDITKEKAHNKVLDHFFMEILSGEIINLIGLEGSGKAEKVVTKKREKKKLIWLY